MIVLAILGGATFLGHDHVLTADAVSGIYTGVLGAVLVGHFTTRGTP